MSGNENFNKDEYQTDEFEGMKVKRYMWPDEVELKKTKKQNKILKFILIASILLSLGVGALLGMTVLPELFNTPISTSGELSKVSTLLDVMSSDWYFAKDIEDVRTRLTDQALYGITTNEEDPHTSYMSEEEMEEFTSSINRNFVGIGVEFINTNGMSLVTKVFKNAPAEKAGVKAGDIIYAADGVLLEDKTSDEIKELIVGDEGTPVNIEFIRDGEHINIEIIRGPVNATAFGYMIDEDTGYIELYQFGDSTASEMKEYLDEFVKGKSEISLIIDLRDNGGGYLDALNKVANFLLPSGTTVMLQEYSDGSQDKIVTKEGQYTQIKNIVILVNENTASASEVLTMALKEQRDDVTVIGTTTYGKGTVQVSRMFTDGSAIKYTTSRWLSPNGVWVNGTGITPDVEVILDDALMTAYMGMEEDETFQYDSVDTAVQETQLALRYLGYTVDRTDGYFSRRTETALKQYETAEGLTADGVLSESDYKAIVASVLIDWHTNAAHDVQLAKALEVLND